MSKVSRSILTKFDPAPEGRTLTGYAAVFDTPASITSDELDGRVRTWTEIIRPGAFARALSSKGDIVATYNHDYNLVLGRTSSGTLKLNEDAHGLRMEIDLPDTATGNEVRELVRRGDLQGASFTFGVKKESWDGNTRFLEDLFLMELGPVVMPAYRATSVGLRSLDTYKKKLKLRSYR